MRPQVGVGTKFSSPKCGKPLKLRNIKSIKNMHGLYGVLAGTARKEPKMLGNH